MMRQMSTPAPARPAPLNQVPLEFSLSDIQEGMHISSLIKLLQPHGTLISCKFTNEQRSEAYIKFKSAPDAAKLKASLQGEIAFRLKE